jgi:deoxyribodipyrimidine photolyase-related protein
MKKYLKNSHNLIDYLSSLHSKDPFSSLCVSKPSEYKTLKDLMYFCQSSGVNLEVFEDNKFITTDEDYKYWAKDKKSTIQEFYYRWLRKKFNILMDENSKPVGGKWNFDKENRQSISKLKSDIPNRNNIITDQITLR